MVAGPGVAGVEPFLVGEESIERLQELVDTLGGDEWICFAGSGLSRQLGAPGWEALALRAAEAFGIDARAGVAGPNLPTILGDCARQAEDAGCAGVFRRFLSEEVCVGNRGETTAAYRAIVRLPFACFVTTNYDLSLKNAHDEVPDVPEPRWLAFPNIHPSRLGQGRLAHIHGVCRLVADRPFGDLPENAVVTITDYDRAYDGTDLSSTLASLFVRSRLLFVGFGFQDDPVREVLNRARLATPRLATAGVAVPKPGGHLALVAAHARALAAQSPAARDYVFDGLGLGIRPIWYSNPDGRHQALLEILSWLVSVRAKPAAGFRGAPGV